SQQQSPEVTCEETVQSQQHSQDITCEETVQSQQHSPDITCEETLQHTTVIVSRRGEFGLMDPQGTGQFASNVLVKTVCFMRCSPSFSQLPPRDRSSLLRHCWVPVFVLGLAQEKIVFKVTDVPSSNILHQILLRPVLTNKEAEQPTLAGVYRLQICLRQLWNLDLSPKEYAYLKGAMLFNPAVQGLSASSFIEGLQQEAERALQEVIHLLHPEDSSRFSRTLRAASAIQTVSHSLVTELFFKPVIGNTNMSHLLTEMLFVH
uniref:Nuclear receptor subfamily 0 group B member 2 n=1 Tax=Amphiprion percula TaxID=161767 RepID=A0A3P8S2R6_AMPPE